MCYLLWERAHQGDSRLQAAHQSLGCLRNGMNVQGRRWPPRNSRKHCNWVFADLGMGQMERWSRKDVPQGKTKRQHTENGLPNHDRDRPQGAGCLGGGAGQGSFIFEAMTCRSHEMPQSLTPAHTPRLPPRLCETPRNLLPWSPPASTAVQSPLEGGAWIIFSCTSFPVRDGSARGSRHHILGNRRKTAEVFSAPFFS